MENFVQKFFVSLALTISACSYADMGLGIVLGQPTGISGRIATSQTTSWDAAMAWNLGSRSYVLIQADHLWSRLDALKLDYSSIDFYYGVGAILALPKSDTELALRIPAGLSYKFRDPSIEMFGELAVAFTLVPATDFDIVGGIGLRYWFN